jgi:hypothetical protein
MVSTKLVTVSLILLGATVACEAFVPLKSNGLRSICYESPVLTPASTLRPLGPALDRSLRKSLTKRDLSVGPIVETAKQVATSIFQYNGHVPIVQAFGLNVFGFTLLRKKLLKSLTSQGYLHAMALGTGLWATLGWRGWTLCVLYLILGQLGKLCGRFFFFKVLSCRALTRKRYEINNSDEGPLCREREKGYCRGPRREARPRECVVRTVGKMPGLLTEVTIISHAKFD